MPPPNAVKGEFGQELTVNAGGVPIVSQSMGSFIFAPSLIIIQNDTNVTVSIARFSDPTQTGISFVAGTRLVLDMVTNRATAEFFSLPANTPIIVSVPAGTGSFKIAYIYGV